MLCITAEQQTNGIQAADTNYRVDYSAEQAAHSSEKGSDHVKLEQTNR